MDKSAESTIGRNVRHRRWMLGLPRRELAKTIGVSTQQLCNYELGATRISASRLWVIATHLETPVAFFFKDLKGSPSATEQVLFEGPQEREMLELFGDFCRVPTSARQELRELARAMADPVYPPN